MTGKLDLDQAFKLLAAKLQDRVEIVFAYAHGSVLEHLAYNDLDTAVFVDPSAVSEKNAPNYELELGVELGLALRFPVDVRVLNYVPASFAYHACRGHLLFCKDHRQRYDFIEAVWREYFDYLPHARTYLREALGIESKD